MSHVLIISEYDPRWPAQFEEEKARIQAVMGGHIRRIEHVGSTSIPGLGAKPVLDLLLIVPDYTPVSACVPLLAQLDYEYRGEAGIPGRHFFRKPAMSISGFERTHHLHLVDYADEQGRHNAEKQLLFREYLRLHPEVASAYFQLKKSLAHLYGSDRASYTNGKADFVLLVLEKARQEHITLSHII